jgi:hypothetical protein
LSMPSTSPIAIAVRVTIEGFDDEASISNSNSVLCDYRIVDKLVYLFSFCAHQVKRNRNFERNSAVDSFGSGPGAVIDLELALFFVPIEVKVAGTSSNCVLVLFLSLCGCAPAQLFEYLVHHSDESPILFSGRFDSVASLECGDLSAFPQAVGLMKSPLLFELTGY